MAEDVSYSNCYISYIKNDPYAYPTDKNTVEETSSRIDTGWQIIPNALFRHFMSPRQWAEMLIKYEAYRVTGCSATVFNMIPMTTQVAIQGTNLFTSFNNCIYAWGYHDELYETSMHDYLSAEAQEKDNLNLVYKEGLYRWNSETNSDYWHQHLLPKYRWAVPHVRTSTDETWGNDSITDCGLGVYPTSGKPSGCIWDPLNRPEHLMELRPGKNSITFNWDAHECDKHLWFNLDGIASWFPYTATGPYNASGNPRPGTYKLTTQMDPDRLSSRYQTGSIVGAHAYTNDYTIPNLRDQPIVPCNWWWHEMRASIVQEFGGKDNNVMASLKPDLWFPGTEYETAKFPPSQWFIKLVPLIANNTLVETYAQIAIKTTLRLQCKPRRSAIYCPTWGPFNWHDLYTASSRYINFHPGMVRYRTGGIRRTWQNMSDRSTTGDTGTSTAVGHYREDPYNTAQTNACGSGTGGTYTLTTTVAEPKPELHITFANKDLKRMRIDTSPNRSVYSMKLTKDNEPMH